jgi:hypothetical protein
MFDMSKIIGDQGAYKERVLAAAAKAVNEFGEQLIGNAQERTPVETGFLQSSGTAADPAMTKDGEIVKVVGFNSVYAAARHERPPEEDAGVRQNPKGEWKFLERAMREMAPKFGEHVNRRVREATE